MNEETQKELLSVNYVRTIAEFDGFITTKFNKDFGEDLAMQKILKRKSKNSFSYFSSGGILSLQIKCTTKRSVKIKNGYLTFALKAKNYNHLIFRKKRWDESSYSPLVFVLVVLPENLKEWLCMSTDPAKLSVSGSAYWFFPDKKMRITSNNFSKSIFIPIENQLTLETFSQIYSNLF